MSPGPREFWILLALRFASYACLVFAAWFLGYDRGFRAGCFAVLANVRKTVEGE